MCLIGVCVCVSSLGNVVLSWCRAFVVSGLCLFVKFSFPGFPRSSEDGFPPMRRFVAKTVVVSSAGFFNGLFSSRVVVFSNSCWVL